MTCSLIAAFTRQLLALRTVYRILLFLSLVAVLGSPSCIRAERRNCGPEKIALDDQWRFHLGEVPNGEHDDTPEGDGWSPVSLPHDWAIAGPFAATNPSGGAGAFAPMGIGWYHRRLLTPPSSCRERTLVQFDGVMANSDVWINGHLLGHRPNGYVSFVYDLTPYLHTQPGAANLLAVRADDQQQPASRFYQGAGIYRHVALLRLPPVHFVPWSIFVTTPTVTSDGATINVGGEIQNSSTAPQSGTVHVTVIDADGLPATSTAHAPSFTLSPGASFTFTVQLKLSHPRRWDLQDPYLYRARTELKLGKHADEEETTTFGVRDAHFDAATGFWLNGHNLKIKGVALHSDVGALGMAAPLSLWEHRLRAMQAMGANAIRTAHNPVAPEVLDLCDRLGMLVLDEFFDQWTVAKNPYDYHLYFRDWYLTDTRDTVRRDRNHPSVIAWSTGNEIHDTPHPEIAKPILAALVAEYHKDDPTRPVTQALFRPNVSHDYQDGLADMLDVVGQNYRPNELLAAHADKPTRRILGTENGHDRANWLAVRDNAPYSGLFVWSGTDYLGESRHWPLFADASGLNDRTDYPKPDSLERQSWWSTKPVVHIVRRVAPTPKAPTDPGYELEQYRPKQTAFPDWTPVNPDPHPEHVEVYSNCAEVALRLNGQSLGSRTLTPDLTPRSWDVPFTPGTLQAQCLEDPKVSETLRTATAPARLELRPETALGQGFDNVALVRLVVVDAAGTPVPRARLPIVFSVQGAATLLATDDADTTYSAPFNSPERSTLDGRAAAYVRATGPGPVSLRAASPGLPTTILELRLK